MIDKKIAKKRNMIIKKTLAVILIGTFLSTNTLCWAGEELFSSTAENSKLAAELRTTRDNFRELYKAAAICNLIEKDNDLDNTASIQDISGKLKTAKNGFENINFTVLPHEITIEIPDEGLAVRYFDPAKANVITPYSDILKLQTKVIGPRLNRQIIHRVKALPNIGTDKNDISPNDMPHDFAATEYFYLKNMKEREGLKKGLQATAEYIHGLPPEQKVVLSFHKKGDLSAKAVTIFLEELYQDNGADHISAVGLFPKYKYLIASNDETVKDIEKQAIRAADKIRITNIPFSLGRLKNGVILLDEMTANGQTLLFVATILRKLGISKITTASLLTRPNAPFMPEIPGFVSDSDEYNPPEDRSVWRSQCDSENFKEEKFLADIRHLIKEIRVSSSSHSDAALSEVDLVSNKKIVALTQALYEMLRSYDKENILSTHGKKILACLRRGETSSDILDFDIERFSGLTYPQAIERLVLPLEMGGLNNGKNLLFISPEEYLEKNPWAVSKRVLAIPEAIRLVEGCSNDCMFCMVGRHRPIRSLPYPIAIQRILQTHLETNGVRGRIGAITYYHGDEDTFHYYDEICGANIVHVIFFEQKFASVIPISHELRTAGYSPFNPSMGYVKDAINQLRAEEISHNTHSIFITYHLFRPEIEEALLQKNEEKLRHIVMAYMQMYKKLFLLNRSFKYKLVLNRTTLENTVNHPKVIEIITRIQAQILEMLKRDDEIKKAFIVFKDEPIGWDWGGRAISTLERLRKAEANDAELIAFLNNLNIDEIISDKVSLPVTNPNNVFQIAYVKYITKNETLFKNTLGENKPDTLVRVPVEAIESIGIDNISNFLATFQEAPNGYVELYCMSGIGEVSKSVYQKYGLRKKPLPEGFKRTRENTVTLFPALKGEEMDQSAIVSRLNTILSPIGLQHDPAGLIRAVILGLKIMDVARQMKEGKPIDKDVIHVDILNQLRDALDPADFDNFNLTPDDIIALAAGDINNILIALKKLVKLLPIMPINAEELRQIYEHVKAVIIAA